MYRWQQRCGLSLSVLQQLIIIISIIFKPMITKPQVVKISQKKIYTMALIPVVRMVCYAADRRYYQYYCYYYYFYPR